MFPAKAARSTGAQRRPKDAAAAPSGHNQAMFGAVGRMENQQAAPSSQAGRGCSHAFPPPTVLQCNTNHSKSERGNILHEQPKTSPSILLLQSQDKKFLIPIPTNTSAVPNYQPPLTVKMLEGSKAASSTDPHLHFRVAMWPPSAPPANLNQNLTPLFNPLECAPDKAHPHTTHRNQVCLLWVMPVFHTKINSSKSF